MINAGSAPRARGRWKLRRRGVAAALTIGAAFAGPMHGARAQTPTEPEVAPVPLSGTPVLAKRPFRLGFWPLVKSLDAQKPLALLD